MEGTNIGDILLFAFEENINKGPSNDLALLLIKSLLASKVDQGVRVDYRRFTEEIKLWSYYSRRDFDLSRSLTDYFTRTDDSLFLRTLVLVLANKDFSLCEEEIIKNTLFTTASPWEIIDTVFTGYLVHLILGESKEILSKLKLKAIDFSQKDFRANYQAYLRSDLESNKSYTIEFEKAKIGLINLLNGASQGQLERLEDGLGALENKDLGQVSRSLNSYLRRENPSSKDSFHRNMANYLVNLRKSRIDPDQVRIDEYILPDIFSKEEGEVFYHSLLNKCMVVKKYSGDHLIIRNKTGTYEFKK